MLTSIILLVVGSLGIAIGFRTGTLAINSGSVDRHSNPLAFWTAMTICILAAIAGAIGMIVSIM